MGNNIGGKQKVGGFLFAPNWDSIAVASKMTIFTVCALLWPIEKGSSLSASSSD